MQDDHEEFVEYRMSPSHFYLGAVFTLIFFVVDLGSVLAVLSNFDGSIRRPVPFAIFIGTFWSGWVILSLFCIAAYFHEKLILKADSFTLIKIASRKIIHLDQITKLEWRLIGNSGRVIVQTVATVVKIEIGNFSRQNQQEIIDYLQSAVSEDLQTGWEESQARMNRIEAARKNPEWKDLVWLSILFFVCSVAPVYLWTYDIGNYLLGIAAACIACGIGSILWSVRLYRIGKKYRNTQRTSDQQPHATIEEPNRLNVDSPLGLQLTASSE